MATDQTPSWKWDVQHVLIVIVYLAALVWVGAAYLEPLIAAGQLSPLVVLPLLLGVASSVGAFFKNPPATLGQAVDDALQVGKDVGKGAERGFVALRTLLAGFLFGLGALTIAVVLSRCTPAQQLAVVPPALDCENAVVNAAISGLGLAAIVAAIPECGLDLGRVIAILLSAGQRDPRVTQTVAHHEALAARMAGYDAGVLP